MGRRDNDEHWSLLEAWQRGDRSAGRRLVDLALPRVARFFRNKVAAVPDDDDLAQKTFLALARVRPNSTDGSFWALVYGIASNVLRQYVHEKYKRAREEADFTEVCVRDLDPHSPSSVAVRTRELRAFVEALRRIPMDDQILVELRYFEGLKAREIAEVTGIPRGSVHRLLERGVERLRAAVAEELAETNDATSLPTVETLEQWADEVRRSLG